ncbi:MAG: hypothetical protein SOZ48_04735 [Eubacterium sp.]|nr:hypothetical protein [Eubacterium sp.]
MYCCKFLKTLYEKCKNKTVHIVTLIGEHKGISIIFAILLVIICTNMMKQGIMCNDELQSRLASYMSGNDFFQKYISRKLYEGRPLSALTFSFFLKLGFLSPNRYIERIMAIISILLCVVLFCYLVYKVFRDKRLSVFLALFLLACMPITFNLFSPSAFATIYNFPFAILIISMIMYLDYIDNGSIVRRNLSLILFVIAVTGYEIFLTFIPVYFFIILLKRRDNKIEFKSIIKKSCPILCTGIAYLITYIILSRLFPSNYAGTQIGGTLSGFLAVIKQLFLSSIPGYFLINGKYRYLYKIYKPKYETNYLFNDMNLKLIIIFCLITLAIILIYRKKNLCVDGKERIRHVIYHTGVIAGSFLMIILPILPNAITTGTQDKVDSGSIASVVTFYSYFFSCFLIIYILNLFLRTMMTKKLNIIIKITAIFIAVLTVEISSRNFIFAEEQNANYNRLVRIENMLQTDTFSLFENKEINARDIYKTKNALGINNDYWNCFSQILGKKFYLLNQDEGAAYTLIDIDDTYFELVGEKEIVVFLDENLDYRNKKVYYKNYWDTMLMQNLYRDNGFYILCYKIDGNRLERINYNELEILKN